MLREEQTGSLALSSRERQLKSMLISAFNRRNVNRVEREY
jgi:hypothetical protein